MASTPKNPRDTSRFYDSAGAPIRTTPEPKDSPPDSTLRITDLICEGPIEGLVNGDQSIIFSGVPLLRNNGKDYNFGGVSFQFVYGYSDQIAVDGATEVESTVNVGQPLMFDIPAIKRIEGTGIDAVRLVFTFDSLFATDDQGNAQNNTVNVKIELKRVDQQEFSNYGTINITQRHQSAFPLTARVDFATTREIETTGQHVNSDIDIRITRLTKDFVPTDRQFGAVTLTSMSFISETKIGYTDSAVIHYKIDSDNFTGDLSKRSVEILGLKMMVPTNYDSKKRTYDGIWDGTFKLAWTSNPAWLAYNLLINRRYGLGQSISEDQINVSDFYAASKYNDELVPNGEGGMEPRYSFNGTINTAQSPIIVLQKVCATFASVIYTDGDKIRIYQDRPAPMTIVVSNTNVLQGIFQYESLPPDVKHTVAAVKWIDPSDNWLPATERVEDPIAIQEMGVIRLELTAYGTTSRAQARRHGLRSLISEQKQSDLIGFTGSIEFLGLNLGDIIGVADNDKVGDMLTGRILDYRRNDRDSIDILFDRPIELNDPATQQATVFTVESEIVQVLPSVLLEDGFIRTFIIDELDKDKPSLDLLNGAIWTYSVSGAELEQYRVVSIEETSDELIQVQCINHYPEKYDLIDNQSYEFDGKGDKQFDKSLELNGEVLNVTLTERLINERGTVFSVADLAWEAPLNNPRVTEYNLQIRRPGDTYFSETITLPSTQRDYILDRTQLGRYEIQINTVIDSQREIPTDVSYLFDIEGLSTPPPDITGFEIDVQQGSSVLVWDPILNLIDLSHYLIRFSGELNPKWENSFVLPGAGNVIGNTLATSSKSGTYMIKAVDTSGNESVTEARVDSRSIERDGLVLVARYSRGPTASPDTPANLPFGIRDSIQFLPTTSEFYPFFSRNAVGNLGQNAGFNLSDLKRYFYPRISVQNLSTTSRGGQFGKENVIFPNTETQFATDSLEATNGFVVNGVLHSEPFNSIHQWLDLTFEGSLLSNKGTAPIRGNSGQPSLREYDQNQVFNNYNRRFSGNPTRSQGEGVGLRIPSIPPAASLNQSIPIGDFVPADLGNIVSRFPSTESFASDELNDDGTPAVTFSHRYNDATGIPRPLYISRTKRPEGVLPGEWTKTITKDDFDGGERCGNIGVNRILTYIDPSVDLKAPSKVIIDVIINDSFSLVDNITDFSEYCPDFIHNPDPHTFSEAGNVLSRDHLGNQIVRRFGQGQLGTASYEFDTGTVPNDCVVYNDWHYRPGNRPAYTTISREEALRRVNNLNEVQRQVALISFDTSKIVNPRIGSNVRSTAYLDFTDTGGSLVPFYQLDGVEEDTNGVNVIRYSTGEVDLTYLKLAVTWHSPSFIYGQNSSNIEVNCTGITLLVYAAETNNQRRDVNYNPALYADGFMPITYNTIYVGRTSLNVTSKGGAVHEIRNESNSGFEIKFTDTNGDLVNETYDFSSVGYGAQLTERIFNRDGTIYEENS